jgi:hypothetical protein
VTVSCELSGDSDSRSHKADSEPERAQRAVLSQLGVGPARGLWTNSGSFAVKGVLNR